MYMKLKVYYPGFIQKQFHFIMDFFHILDLHNLNVCWMPVHTWRCKFQRSLSFLKFTCSYKVQTDVVGVQLLEVMGFLWLLIFKRIYCSGKLLNWYYCRAELSVFSLNRLNTGSHTKGLHQIWGHKKLFRHCASVEKLLAYRTWRVRWQALPLPWKCPVSLLPSLSSWRIFVYSSGSPSFQHWDPPKKEDPLYWSLKVLWLLDNSASVVIGPQCYPQVV